METVTAILKGGWSILVGLGITFRRMLRPPVTLRYPEERPELPPIYRGMPALLSDPETGELRCTACGVCQRTCPLEAIHMEPAPLGPDKKKRPASFTLDMGRCMVCGLCAEACAFNALTMAGRYELAGYTRQDLIFSLEELAEIGRGYRENNQAPPRPAGARAQDGGGVQ
ncbi:MAG: NADH-quinone oxidoreductase subunit I [Bacillota bacterium]|nr:NADH-quinone oxidoreductase subunit I [Bacillota bacterium]